MQSNKDVSFIILNYNDANTTIKLVDSLRRWQCDKMTLHIVVVDNCSTDDSFTVLQSILPPLRKN